MRNVLIIITVLAALTSFAEASPSSHSRDETFSNFDFERPTHEASSDITSKTNGSFSLGDLKDFLILHNKIKRELATLPLATNTTYWSKILANGVRILFDGFNETGIFNVTEVQEKLNSVNQTEDNGDVVKGPVLLENLSDSQLMELLFPEISIEESTDEINFLLKAIKIFIGSRHILKDISATILEPQNGTGDKDLLESLISAVQTGKLPPSLDSSESVWNWTEIIEQSFSTLFQGIRTILILIEGFSLTDFFGGSEDQSMKNTTTGNSTEDQFAEPGGFSFSDFISEGFSTFMFFIPIILFEMFDFLINIFSGTGNGSENLSELGIVIFAPNETNSTEAPLIENGINRIVHDILHELMEMARNSSMNGSIYSSAYSSYDGMNSSAIFRDY